MWDFFWIRKDRERNELLKRANEALFKAEMDTILWRQQKAEEAAPFNWDSTPDLAQATWKWPRYEDYKSDGLHSFTLEPTPHMERQFYGN